MSKWSSTAIEVCEYHYLSAPNGEKNKKNVINFAVESILPCTGIYPHLEIGPNMATKMTSISVYTQICLVAAVGAQKAASTDGATGEINTLCKFCRSSLGQLVMACFNGYLHFLQYCLFLMIVIKSSANQNSVVGPRNSSFISENVQKVITDRLSFLKRIALGNLEEIGRKECNTTSFVIITRKQYGEQ